MKIALKFCGHCRPNINMPRIACLLRQKHPDIEFISTLQDISECTTLLSLNACPVACATVPGDYDGKVISISCLPGENEYDVYKKCIRKIYPDLSLAQQTIVTA